VSNKTSKLELVFNAVLRDGPGAYDLHIFQLPAVLHVVLAIVLLFKLKAAVYRYFSIDNKGSYRVLTTAFNLLSLDIK
jgi:hypothetical protein